MLQILREFSTDPILSIYVIDDVWEYMKAMKVTLKKNYVSLFAHSLYSCDLYLLQFLYHLRDTSFIAGLEVYHLYAFGSESSDWVYY